MQRSRIRFLTAAVFLCAVVLARPVRALVVLPADLQDLVSGARAIVQGTVTDVRAEAGADRRQIDTLVSLDVSTYLKGDLGPRVTFRVPGGQIGRYRRVIVGAPVFVPGDEVILFLSARGPSVPYVLGLSQGVFRVTRREPDGEPRVVASPFVSLAADRLPVRQGESARRQLPLAEFVSLVRSLNGVNR